MVAAHNIYTMASTCPKWISTMHHMSQVSLEKELQIKLMNEGALNSSWLRDAMMAKGARVAGRGKVRQVCGGLMI